MNEVFEDVTKLLEENGYSIRDYLREVGVHSSALMNLSSEAQEEFNRYYDQLIVGVTDKQDKPANKKSSPKADLTEEKFASSR